MSDKDDCGSCDYQGDFIGPQRAECRIDRKVYERGYRCEDFTIVIPSKHLMVREGQATEKRREREAKASDERNREFAEKMAQQEREYTAEIARINRQHADELAQKDRDHDAKLQQERMEFDRIRWKAGWWWQTILVVGGGVVGFIVRLLIKP